ncbi:MAG: monovalent cation/H(+) antiporter subunit G [Candidatus Omnitrophica bacterium]|nr:monovalent cation/H(+) antiporter subunit G [Candidatus Omnitrophota bacterium]
MNEIIAKIFILIGIMFNLFGCLGLVRLPDIYSRLHASVKCVMLGTTCILFGLFLFRGFDSAGIKALICILFIILTAPVSAHALARAAHISGIKLCNKSVCDKYSDSKEAK